ncbi:MAG: hypothetical protein IJ993_07075 [Akkermansia sp.]|nr:hypothetical protein [Akkermansia sp.]
MKGFHNIIAAMGLLACGSCTFVDLGGAVDNVGRELPVCAELARIGKRHQHATVWQTADGKRYLEVDVYYLPARAKWFHCYMVGGCPKEAFARFYRPLFLEQKPQTFYAEIEGDAPYTVKSFVAAAQLDLSLAKRSVIHLPNYHKQAIVCAHLPEQRSALNTALQPLRWAAELADVPLSCIATPVNWLILPTGFSLWAL